MRRTAALTVVACLALFGCQDDSDGSSGRGGSAVANDPEARPYVEAMARALRFDGVDDDGGMSAEGAECMAGVAVAALGVDNLEAAGLTPADLEEADDLADLEPELEVDRTEVARAISRGSRDCGMAAEVARIMTGEVASKDNTDCLAEAFDTDVFHDAVGQGYIGEEDDEQLGEMFGGAFSGCPGALSDMMLANFGDDLSDDDRECVEREIEANIEELASAMFTTGSSEESFEALEECLLG